MFAAFSSLTGMRLGQPSGSFHLTSRHRLRNATWRALLGFGVAGCAQAQGPDLAMDAATVDAPPPRVDAPRDTGSLDAGCGISSGITLALDGVGDLAKYPAAQRLTPGAQLTADDAAAVAWDSQHLYVTTTSSAFVTPFEPLHVYVEAAPSLAPVAASQGKEYGGLVPELPFAATHVVAIRRVTDVGGVSYNGVYVPAGAWMSRETALEPSTDVFASADQRTLSVKVPWTALGGCPSTLRLALHVVHDIAGNEWKDLVPGTHTPWIAPGGGYFEIDLTGDPAVAGWTLR